jgi:hypothetical protein
MKNVFGVIDTACTKISDKKVKFLSETEFKKALAHESGAQKKLQWAPKVYPVFFFFLKIMYFLGKISLDLGMLESFSFFFY